MPRLFVILTALSLAACNTIAGAGRDMQNVGATIQQRAQGLTPVAAPTVITPSTGVSQTGLVPAPVSRPTR